jgi:hypothetical protein
MSELRTMRSERREGIWPVPMRTVLAQEYLIQKRAEKALRKLVAHETAILESLESLINDANIELPKCQAARDQAWTDDARRHRDLILARHISMLQELQEQQSDRAERVRVLTEEFKSNEEHPVEQQVRRYDTSPMPVFYIHTSIIIP